MTQIIINHETNKIKKVYELLKPGDWFIMADTSEVRIKTSEGNMKLKGGELWDESVLKGKPVWHIQAIHIKI